MKTKHEWHSDMCFNCTHLDVREKRDGKIVYWCARRKGPVSDEFIWRRDCRRFQPLPKKT